MSSDRILTHWHATDTPKRCRIQAKVLLTLFWEEHTMPRLHRSLSPDDDLRAILQASPYNRQAGAVLRQHRKSIGMTQVTFCTELAREFGYRAMKPSTLSGWETGERGVPGSVLTAAAAVAQRVTGTKPVSLEDKTLDSLERIEAGVLYLLG